MADPWTPMMFTTAPHKDLSQVPTSSEVARDRAPVASQEATADVGSDRLPQFPTGNNGAVQHGEDHLPPAPTQPWALALAQKFNGRSK